MKSRVTFKDKRPAKRIVKAVNGKAVNGNGHSKSFAKRMYAAAAADRLTLDWRLTQSSANAQIMVSRPQTIARSQELERDNSWMEKTLEIKKNNVIGHQGVRLQMGVKFKNGKPDKKTNDLIEAGWLKYCRQENCTVSGTISGIELQWLAARCFERDGGMLLRKRRAYDNAFRWAVEPIDISRLDHNWNAAASNPDANFIEFGVEMNRFRKPLAYHILSRHPGEHINYEQARIYRERVPADEIIAFWTIFRPSQTVMMPRTTSVMKRLNMLDKYDQAELTAAFVASCKGGFLEKTAVTVGNAPGDYVGEQDQFGNTTQEIQPGMIEELPYGVAFKANEPNHPTDAYPDFIKGQLRGVASGAGIPYNDLANDLEGVNYSSIRSGMTECREGYKCDQRLVIEKLMTPWFEEWLQYAIMSRQLPFSMDEYDRLNKPCWKPKRWGYINPVDDVNATLKAIDGGLTSRSAEVAENDADDDYEAVCDQQKLDKETEADAGLEFVTDTTVKLQVAEEQAEASKQAAATTAKASAMTKPVDKAAVADGEND